MKSKTAVPILVVLFMATLVAGLIGQSFIGGLKHSAVSASASSLKAVQDELEETIFPKDKVVDVKITIDEADFQDMLDNATLEEYKSASVEYNGIKLDNVGIRTKGNLTLRSVAQMSDSDRYSFKLSFDEYLSNQTLYGISKINLNNNYSDASYMREFLAYELAEQLGLPTPEVSYVNVYVNGELWGFYLAVEQVDDAYLERHFGNSYGALYKGEMNGSGSDLAWLGEDLSSYTGLAQKSDSSNNDIVVDMINELNNGTDYESVLNVDNVLKYIALNVATNNMDSYLGSNKQNYYLYEDDGIFNILPWDYNMAFGGMGGGMGEMGFDGGGRAQDGAAEAGADNSVAASVLIDEPTQGAVAERPLVAKLLAVEEYKERYHEILTSIVEGYLSEEQFAARVQEVSGLISAYVEKDPTAFYTFEQYQQGVEQLKTTNAAMVTSIIQQLGGTISSTNNGQGSGNGMGGGMRGGRVAMAGFTQNAAEGQTGEEGAVLPQGQAPEEGAVTQQEGQGTQEEQTGQPGVPPQQGQQAPGEGAATQQGQAPGEGAVTQQGQAPEEGAAMQEGQGNQEEQTGQQQGGQRQPGQGGQQGFPQQQMPGNDGEMPAFGGGGGMPGMAGQDGQQMNDAASVGDTNEAITSGILVLVLLLTCLFITFYKRQR